MNEKRFGNIIPLEQARAERQQRALEEQDPQAADKALVEDLVQKMSTLDEYDLLVVKNVHKTLEDFEHYLEIFRIYKAEDEVKLYETMYQDLSEALAQYERRA